jgi:hypothetical protein
MKVFKAIRKKKSKDIVAVGNEDLQKIIRVMYLSEKEKKEVEIIDVVVTPFKPAYDKLGQLIIHKEEPLSEGEETEINNTELVKRLTVKLLKQEKMPDDDSDNDQEEHFNAGWKECAAHFSKMILTWQSGEYKDSDF